MPDLKALGAWVPLLEKELHAPYFEELQKKVADAYAHTAVFPPEADVFHAFSLTPPERVRVVILGQDPYHEPGQAHGLAFSVQKGVKLPPSLQNISKELQADLGLPPLSCGCLTPWARQGVFLLNTVLTVEARPTATGASAGSASPTPSSPPSRSFRSRSALCSGARRRRKRPPSARPRPIHASCWRLRIQARSAPTADFSGAARSHS